MKRITMLQLLCCIWLLCGANTNVYSAVRYAISASTAPSGSNYCYGSTSPAYTATWTQCTGTGMIPGYATIAFQWYIDPAIPITGPGSSGTFTATTPTGILTLPAGTLSGFAPGLTGPHSLYVKYTWTNFAGCISSPLTSPWHPFSVVQSPCIATTASPSTICSSGTSALSASISNSTYNTANAATFYIAPTATGTHIVFSDWDEGHELITLPFTFFHYGIAYNSVWVHVNGYISFGNSIEDNTSYTIPTSSEVPNIIAAFQHDLDLTGSAGFISYTTNGTSPNRTFVIHYANVPDAAGGAINSGQIVLYEGCSQFDIILLDVPSNVSTCGTQDLAGINGVAPAGRNGGGSAWTVSAGSPETWHFTGIPTTGYSYSWTPIADIATGGGSSLAGTVPLYATTNFSVTVTDVLGCSTTAVQPVTVTGSSTQTWNGSVDADWNNAGNWDCGHVPVVTEDVFIPGSVVPAPTIALGGALTGYANNLTFTGSSTILTVIAPYSLEVATDLTINSGSSLSLGSATEAHVKGNVENQGSVAGDGKLVMDGTSPQTIKSTGTGAAMKTISNLEIFSDVSIVNTSGYDPIGITGAVTFNPGASQTFTTNDYLVLISNASGTARIGVIPTASGANVSGEVMCQQYIPGSTRKAWRFLGHPFDANLSSGLSQMASGVDITGAGAPSNCFVASSLTSNAPTAYSYNVMASNSLTFPDPGWTAYTSACGGTGNEMGRYQGIRVLVRGLPGQGLSALAAPSPTTFEWHGNINQGTLNVPMAFTTHTSNATFTNFSIPSLGYNDYDQTYNCISNPYPSPVNIARVLARNYTGPTAQYTNTTSAGDLLYSSFFWVFQPNMGTSGQYLPVSFAPGASPYYGDFYIPGNTMFQVRANPIYSGTPNLVFYETDKSATITSPSGGALLKRSSPEFTELTVNGPDGNLWDIIKLNFSDAATADEDVWFDAGKLMGFDYNFFTVSQDKHPLSYDYRPFKEEQAIALGMRGITSEHLTIKATSVAVPDGKAIYLHDKQLGNYELLSAGMEYSFDFDAAAENQSDRFELAMKPASFTNANINIVFAAHLSPNPTSNEVTISVSGAKEETAFVTLSDVTGRIVLNRMADLTAGDKITLDVHNLTPGIYLAEIKNGKNKVVQKLIKE